MADRETRRWLLILFLVAAALRVGWVSFRFSGDRSDELSYPDEEAYCLSAESLNVGKGLVDEFGYRATYMPAYPVFLSLFYACPRPLFWARIVQSLLGALAAPATFLLAKRWARLALSDKYEPRKSKWITILAGLAVAFDPFQIFFSGLLLTETLFTTGLVVAWIFILPLSEHPNQDRFYVPILAGVMLWICIMLRPSAVILVILVPLVLVICRGFDRVGIGLACLIVVVVIVGLLPWVARNRMVIGEWCWLTTRGGISLYDGLREGATGASDLAHTKTIPQVANMNEIQWDDYFRRQAWSAARRDPVRVLQLAWYKFLRMWNLVPNVDIYRKGITAVISATWMVLILISAAIGWWMQRRVLRYWVMLLLPVLGFTFLHTIFVASIRYRIPVMPMIIILSATGGIMVLNRIWSRAGQVR
ncbi:MAG: hypothetical protein JSV03_04650 [Planctomycetota bacterium]|nr:MAG: hypothetical protein JSV03_04650 [Planctomycetota bacterium]